MDRLAQRNRARKLADWLKKREALGAEKRKQIRAAQRWALEQHQQKRAAEMKILAKIAPPIPMGDFERAVACLRRAQINPNLVANDNESAFSGSREFAHKLMKRGFKHIGSGAYSRVVAKDGSDKCIKVCRHAQSDGWVDYVLWANKNGYGGTFAPKIYSYKWIKCKGSEDGFGVAVMERMKQTASHAKRTEDAKFLPTLFEYGVYANDNAKLLADLVQPGIGNFIDDFRKEFGEDANFDLHNGNFMVREDGSFCVSDPLAGTSSTAYNIRYRRTA